MEPEDTGESFAGRGKSKDKFPKGGVCPGHGECGWHGGREGGSGLAAGLREAEATGRTCGAWGPCGDLPFVRSGVRAMEGSEQGRPGLAWVFAGFLELWVEDGLWGWGGQN